MKRTGFARPQYEPAPRTPLQALVRQVNAGPSEREPVAVEKRVYVRSKALREAYRLIPCQFVFDGVVCGRTDTCCCHANSALFGKAMGVKADDSRAAAGCAMHHHLLDQGSSWSKQERRLRFWAAHVRSVTRIVEIGAWPAGVPRPDCRNFPKEWT